MATGTDVNIDSCKAGIAANDAQSPLLSCVALIQEVPLAIDPLYPRAQEVLDLLGQILLSVPMISTPEVIVDEIRTLAPVNPDLAAFYLSQAVIIWPHLTDNCLLMTNYDTLAKIVAGLTENVTASTPADTRVRAVQSLTTLANLQGFACNGPGFANTIGVGDVNAAAQAALTSFQSLNVAPSIITSGDSGTVAPWAQGFVAPDSATAATVSATTTEPSWIWPVAVGGLFAVAAATFIFIRRRK